MKVPIEKVFEPIFLNFKKGLGISHFPSKWTFTVNLPIRRMAKDCYSQCETKRRRTLKNNFILEQKGRKNPS